MTIVLIIPMEIEEKKSYFCHLGFCIDKVSPDKLINCPLRWLDIFLEVA